MQFDFLAPPEIGLFGIVHEQDSEEYKMEQLKRAVHEALGKKLPTLKDIVKEAINDVHEREKKAAMGRSHKRLPLHHDHTYGVPIDAVEKPEPVTFKMLSGQNGNNPTTTSSPPENIPFGLSSIPTQPAPTPPARSMPVPQTQVCSLEIMLTR